MCEWGNTTNVSVLIPPSYSSTGEFKSARKPVDRCIVDIVKALNNAELYTLSSCCGHGKRRGSIILHDGRTLIIKGK